MARVDLSGPQMGVHPDVVSGISTWNPKTPDRMYPRRRRFPRWQLTLPIRELSPEGHVMRATSVSAGGLFCPDVPPRQRGSELVLEIDLLSGGKSLVVPARVVYAGTSPGGLGIGVAFCSPQRSLGSYLFRLPRAPVTYME